MKIAVIGMGYVGCVAAAKLAATGFDVIGIDRRPRKIEQIGLGKCPVYEPGLDKVFEQAVRAKKLTAASRLSDVVDQVDVFYICVGTPVKSNGELDLSAIFRVVSEIKAALTANVHKTIVIRSTVKPGTNAQIKQDLAHFSVSVVSNPEFLREGSALNDWDHPGIVVIGCSDKEGQLKATELYRGINAQYLYVQPKTAEVIKYVNNSWHALKVAFGNELGRVAQTLDIDPKELLDVFLADAKLNISGNYLRPGMPYGGSCLVKDLKAFNTLAASNQVKTPLLDSVSVSNKMHVEHIIRGIKQSNFRRVGFFGLAFKSNTDDLRYSASLTIVQKLMRAGYQVSVFDEAICQLLMQDPDAHNNHLLQKLPRVRSVLVSSLGELAQASDLVVLAHPMSAEEVDEYFSDKTIFKAYELE